MTINNIMRTMILIIFIAGCLNEPEGNVKAALKNDPAYKAYSLLFNLVIGRDLGGHEEIKHQEEPSRNMTALFNFWRDDEKNISLDEFYLQTVDILLNSAQYVDEGFLHLHKRRLLLSYQYGGRVLADKKQDYDSFKAELANVAKTDDYAQLFTYRQRYLPLADNYGNPTKIGTPPLVQGGCVDKVIDQQKGKYSKQEAQATANPKLTLTEKCKQFLLAKFLPGYNDPAICETDFSDSPPKQVANKFSVIYHQRCGPSIAASDEAFCARLHKGYKDFLGKNYKDISKDRSVDDDRVCADEGNKNNGGDEDYDDSDDDSSQVANIPADLNIKLKDNFINLVYFYISLALSQDSEVFIAAEPPTNDHLYASDDGSIFIKAKMPESMQGLHANPFWLFSHHSSARNKNLRRARLLLYSWFCRYISPDTANPLGDGVTQAEKDAFKKYFDPDDEHASSDQNCFGCHKLVQPLANYFDQLSYGVSYANLDDLAVIPFKEKFLQPRSNVKSAGYYDYDSEEFSQHGKGQGMSALADLLQHHPDVHQCIVRSTWNGIFGHNNRLTSQQVNAAVATFKNNNYSYRALLKHLLTHEKASTYFLQGQEALDELIAAEQEVDCAAVTVTDEIAQGIFNTNCHGCHANDQKQFYTKLKNDSGEETYGFKDDSDEKTYNEVYRRLAATEPSEVMPRGGFGADGDNKKVTLLCYMRQKAKAKGYTLTSAANDKTQDQIIQPPAADHAEPKGDL